VPSQRFVSRLAAVFGGELINKGSVVVAFMWLARTIEPAAYGQIEWALSVTMVLILFADAGLSTWAAAQVASDPAQTPHLIAQIGWLRLCLALASYSLVVVIAALYGGPAGSAVAITGLVLWLTPFFLQYVFNGLLRTGWAALGNAVRGLTFLLVVVSTVHAGASPAQVAIAEVLGATALALCNVVVLRTVFKLHVPVRAGIHGLGSILARSWRIGATELTWGVHWYAGLILLGYVATSTDAAWHSASLRLVMALHTGVWLYLYVLLPNLARVVTRDPDAWRELVGESLRLTSWAGAAIAVVGTLGAEPILTLIFGAPFVAAVPGFRAAVWVVPVAWMSGHIRYSLIAAQQQHLDYRAGLVGAATTIAVTLALAPSFGSAGSGIALLVGTIANAVAAWALAQAVLPGFAYLRQAGMSSAACIVCLGVGLVAGPALGQARATVLAGGLFALLAVLAERRTVEKFGQMLIDHVRKGAGRADVRT
jgi:O-antigen/teichoic acid export membrane protein